MLKLRGFLISAIVLTPVLGLPWIVSFLKIATVGVENNTVQYILDKFIDWVFICLNGPSGIIFMIIVASRVKEFRATKQKKEISTRLTSVTSGQHPTKIPRAVSSAADKYKRNHTGRVRTDSNSRQLIAVHSEQPDTARFASDIHSKEIDHDKMDIPAGCPQRPTLPRGYNTLTSQYSIETTTYVCEDANTVYKNTLCVSIEDLTKGKPTEENDSIFENIYQNLSTIEQGSTQKERSDILEDLAIPNPLFESAGLMEVDIPVTNALSSSKTSLCASNVSLHKLHSDKIANCTAIGNPSADVVVTDETETISHRVSPLFERETEEGFLRRSLNKIRSSLRLSQSTIPQQTPEPPVILCALPKPIQSSAVHQNRYIEHLNRLYQDKKKLTTKPSVILNSLLTQPPAPGSVSPSPTPKLPAPYAGSRVKTLRERFDSINTSEMQPFKTPPARPPRFVPTTEIHLPTIHHPTTNTLQTPTHVEPQAQHSISSIVIDEQPLSLNTLTSDFYNPFKTTDFTQVPEEVESSTKQTVDIITTNTVSSPSEQHSCPEVYDAQVPQPPIELKLNRFSLQSISYDQDETSQNTPIVTGVVPNSQSPVKLRRIQFSSLSPNSEDQDTISNASSTNSPNKPISFTFKPPQDLKTVVPTKYEASTSPDAEQDTSPSPPREKRPQAKLSRNNAFEEEPYSPTPVRPNPSTQFCTGDHGAFTAPLRPKPRSSGRSGSAAAQRLSDPSGLLAPTRKRSNSKISDRISFFDDASQSNVSRTLPRSGAHSHITSPIKGITQSTSSNKLSAARDSEPISPPTVQSPPPPPPPSQETTGALQTEL